MASRFIVVEGPIGVGKSSFAKSLSESLNAQVYYDQTNPFLHSFYDDMDTYAFQVQLYFLLARFQQQKELAQGDLFSQTMICDYLFQKDRLFASLTLSPNEYALYEKVFSLLKGTIANPDVVIYLQAGLDTLRDRIAEKDEGLGLLLPESYLKEIIQAYQTFFFHYNQAPVIVCNTEKTDYLGNEENLRLLIRKIEEVRSGVHYLNPEGA